MNLVLPTDIVANDTIDQKLTGFSTSMSMAGVSIIDQGGLMMFITGGLSAGRLKMTNNLNERIKNPHFGAFAGGVVRVSFGKLSVFMLAQVDYDISSDQWKSFRLWETQENIFPGFKQHGVLFRVGLNYSLAGVYKEGRF